MSTGRTHRKASLILASAFSVGAIVTLKPELIQCAMGSLVGMVVSPDQDVDAGNISNKIVKRNLGSFAEKIWRLFWSGYSKSFKNGSFGSHFPVYGTFVRIAYIYFWCIFLPHLAIYLTGITNWNLIYVLEWYARIFIGWHFIGLASSDLIHYFLDILTTNAE